MDRAERYYNKTGISPDKNNVAKIIHIKYKKTVEQPKNNYLYYVMPNDGKDKRFPVEEYKWKALTFSYAHENDLKLRTYRGEYVCDNWECYYTDDELEKLVLEGYMNCEDMDIWNHNPGEILYDKTKMTYRGELNVFEQKLEDEKRKFEESKME